MRYNLKTVLLIFTYRTIFKLFTFLVEKFRDRMRLKITIFYKRTVYGTILAHALRGFQKQCVQSVSGKAPT